MTERIEHASDPGDLTADQLAVGSVVEVEVGPVAHGGHCVARYQGRVVFVRLALPGERVRVRITDARRGSFCRGEAIEVLRADPDRVAAPCRHYRPGGCGGCDFQHATPARQRSLKAAVVAEQLHRLAGVDREVIVQELRAAVAPEPAARPDPDWHWRTRVRWAADRDDHIGPRAFRSAVVQDVGPDAPCLIAAPGLSEAAAELSAPRDLRRPAVAAGVGVGGVQRPGRPNRSQRGGPRGRRAADPVRPPDPEVVLVRRPGEGPLAVWTGPDHPSDSLPSTRAHAGMPAGGPTTVAADRTVAHPDAVQETALGRTWQVAADGFWQAHPAAVDTLGAAVDRMLEGRLPAGGTAWDLYGGVGVFAEVLARRVGADGVVVTVEGDTEASRLAAANLADRPQVTALCGAVEQRLGELPGRVDAIVLDPPRSGAGAGVCRQLADRRPAVLVYVACDPAALARDTAALQDAGYRLAELEAFDCFPQTHHVECVAAFVPEPNRD
ncbi:class I SAM-dependent RNA methyltransferase [Nakamurella leprariae]|uniref:Class I SAM-dependent RNA methyltransferase n=1 Tax=Nakamurella leprariae TaxID=2803911 RepID=A0A938YCH8_9ACTN|nr:TRAM domain-containing protein [Nakamurella leprariae]MBM9467098.1 class I SAM-dependent RNA methyltransferase [Nakamurella leprariae]